MRKIFLWITGMAGGLLLLAVLLLAVLAFVQIPIDLTGQKALLEQIAGKALDRQVSINGKIEISTSLEPSFSINKVHIRNKDGFPDNDFIVIGQAHLQLALLPLLRGKMLLRELRAQGLAVSLQENELGNNNWSSANHEERAESSADTKQLTDRTGLASDTLVVDRLELEDIAVSFTTPDTDKPFVFTIENCTGVVKPGHPTSLDLNGAWLTHPFTSMIRISSLQELLEQDRSWMRISTEIAATELTLEGTIDLVTVLDSLNLKATIRGEQLTSLNELLHMDLLPLESYEAVAELTLKEKLLNLNKLHLKVRDSSLEGNIVVDVRGERPDVHISMTAPFIQLRDFDFNKSDIETSRSTPHQKTGQKKAPEDAPAQEIRKDKDGLLAHLSQDRYSQFDVTATIQLEKVQSGSDDLGGGHLKANLQKGRFSIDPLQLDIPGGSLVLRMSLQPGAETSAAALTIMADNFDFGVMARKAKPGTNMGGTLNLAIDLNSTGGSMEEILANGTGYIDFSARPVNLNSGIMDLWVVNLLSAIIFRGNKEGSPINCMFSRWSMDDGLLTPDAFAVDTGTMRICGAGNINLKKNTLDLKIAPTPKREQFFSLATPFSITGRIPDIKMGFAAGGLFGTSIRFVASPITTPLSWLVAQKIPVDGSDICSLPIGPNNRPAQRLPGCRR